MNTNMGRAPASEGKACTKVRICIGREHSGRVGVVRKGCRQRETATPRSPVDLSNFNFPAWLASYCFCGCCLENVNEVFLENRQTRDNLVVTAGRGRCTTVTKYERACIFCTPRLLLDHRVSSSKDDRPFIAFVCRRTTFFKPSCALSPPCLSTGRYWTRCKNQFERAPTRILV